MKIMDILIDEINKGRPEDDKFERLNSEPYRIIETDHGTFRNPIRKENTYDDKQ